MHDLRSWLTLIRAPGIGPIRCAALLERFGEPGAVLAASTRELETFGLPRAALDYLRRPDNTVLDRDQNWLEQSDCHLLTRNAPNYPPLLQEIGAPPPALFVRGDPDLLCEPQLAIVGTRNPTPTGRAIASEFAEQLTSAGLVITSGLALGIDAAGHEGALAAGGSTIAVLGTGPDRIYPARNQSLARAIAEQGALVTELPPGTTARAEHFPRRNRLISGLTLGTLVIEAAPQSGSLITARLAAEQGREVFAVPGSVRNPVARGCHQLLREGARLVESSTDVLQELAPRLSGLLRDETTPEPAAAVALEPVTELSDEGYRILLDRLDEEPTAVDTLVERTGLTADVVSSMLLILELHGYVSAAPGGRYRRVIFEGH